jgi:hypothetical protein
VRNGDAFYAISVLPGLGTFAAFWYKFKAVADRGYWFFNQAVETAVYTRPRRSIRMRRISLAGRSISTQSAI